MPKKTQTSTPPLERPDASGAEPPSVGAIVLYRLPAGPKRGETRPAMVMRASSDGSVELALFTLPGDGNAWSRPIEYVSATEGDDVGEWRRA